MAIVLIDKIAPKNDAFTGMVDADQVIGGGDAGTLPDACISEINITQHEAAIDHDQLTNFTTTEHFTQGSISIPASQISDFDTEVSNNTSVSANTTKVSNATHTGEVTGSAALILDKTAVTGKSIVTAIGADYVLISDTDDAGNLKRALISDFASAGGDMAAATYDPNTIASDTFDMDNMVEGTTTKILTDTERSEISANTAKITNATHTGDVTGNTALTISTDAVDIPMLSATGTASSSTFLRGDNTWSAPAGGGTVTSVDAGDGLDFVSITGSGDVIMGTPGTTTASTTNAVTPTSHTHQLDETGITITASQVSDFDTEVGNNSSVTANTSKVTNVTTDLSAGTKTATTIDVNSSDGTNATLVEADTANAGILGSDKWDEIVANTSKISNATHIGEVTGSTTLTVGPTTVTNKTAVTALGSDYVLISDTSDSGLLKKALISDFASAGGDMAAATYDPNTIASDVFDMDNMVEGTNTKILTGSERTIIGNTSGTNTGDQTISDATISITDITTNDVSSTKHGFAPKGDGSATSYLDGTGSYSTPAGGGGITWNEVTGTSQGASVDNGYITNNAGLVTVTLPDTAALGSTLRIAGLGAGGWKLAQNASESVYFGNSTTIIGIGGSLASTHSKDSIELVCVVANTEWSVISSVGNITIV